MIAGRQAVGHVFLVAIADTRIAGFAACMQFRRAVPRSPADGQGSVGAARRGHKAA